MNQSIDTLSRRSLLCAAIAASLCPLSGCNTSQQSTLSVLVDTIIPADETTGAVDVGIDNMIQEQLSNKRIVIENMTALLDEIEHRAQQHVNQFSQRFSSLNQAQREALLHGITNEAHSHVVSALQQLRRHVLHRFYTLPVGQASLNYCFNLSCINDD